jgi:hypothetical protein
MILFISIILSLFFLWVLDNLFWCFKTKSRPYTDIIGYTIKYYYIILLLIGLNDIFK